MRTVLVSAFAALVGAGAALAQPTEMPAIGAPRAFDLPATQTFELDNGLDVTLIPFGLAPKTTISVSVRAGNLNDGEQTWIADLAAELLQQGAADRSAEAIAQEAAAMGGQLNVSVGRHVTDFDIAVLSERGPDAIQLIADVIRRPDLPESEIERLKADFRRILSVSLAEPGPVADAALYDAVYGADHPYGRMLPSDAQLASYTAEDARAFYRANYGARRTHVYVSGQFDARAMRAAIEAALGDWEAGPEPLALPATLSAGPRIILIDRPGAEQTTLRLAVPVPATGSADDVPLRVVNALLGGSFTSRLVQNLREENGYTYSPNSGFARTLAGSHWAFSADVATPVTGPALAETFGEIERLAAETPPAEEARGIRNWLAGVFVLQNASPAGLIGQVSERDLFNLPSSWLEDYVPAVMAVSDAAFSALAREHLPTGSMILVAVGDLAAIEDEIRALPELAGVDVEVRRGPGG
jgi:predicted Zn-dependent peptidase